MLLDAKMTRRQNKWARNRRLQNNWFKVVAMMARAKRPLLLHASRMHYPQCYFSAQPLSECWPSFIQHSGYLLAKKLSVLIYLCLYQSEVCTHSAEITKLTTPSSVFRPIHRDRYRLNQIYGILHWPLSLLQSGFFQLFTYDISIEFINKKLFRSTGLLIVLF